MKNSKKNADSGKGGFGGKKGTLSNSLVSYKNNSNTAKKDYCGKFPLLGPLMPEKGYHVSRILCKTNGCSFCWPIKLAIRKREVKAAAKKYKLRVFATLTIPNSVCSAEESVKYIQKVWNRYRCYRRKKYGQLPDFISILEFTKRGYAHLHVLLSDYIPWKDLNKEWKALGGGHVDLKGADDNAPNYLAKYLNYADEKITAKGARLINCSRSIKLKLRNPNSEYKFHKIKYADLKSTFKDSITQESIHYSGIETGFYTNKPIVIID